MSSLMSALMSELMTALMSTLMSYEMSMAESTFGPSTTGNTLVRSPALSRKHYQITHV
jgi:hypothetical protein